MIPSLLTRQLSRPTVVAMALHCSRPAIGSPQSQVTQWRPAAQQSFFSDDATAPTENNNNNGTNVKDSSHHTTKDVLASILCNELKLSAKDSKQAVDTIFDTIVEVRQNSFSLYLSTSY
jgi:hypothetical protein